MTPDKPLKLRARDVDDLAVVSAMLQDALVPLGDISHLADENSFVLAVNRFRWELNEAGDRAERTHAGLRFDAVRRVSYRGIDRTDRGRFLSLLAIAFDGGEDGGAVVIHFAGGGAIRLEVGGLYCALADLGSPWPTMWSKSKSAIVSTPSLVMRLSVCLYAFMLPFSSVRTASRCPTIGACS